MKQMVWMLALAGTMVFANYAWAGSGCCPGYSKSAKKMEDKSAKWSGGCTSALSGIELSDEQKVQVAAYEAECKDQGNTKEACSASMSKIRDVLTDDQKVTFDAASAKSSGGCGS